MNSVRVSAIKLGIVAVVIIVMGAMIFTALQTPVTGKLHTYSAEISDVSGVAKGTDVRMAGVLVGKVTDVELDGTVADVTFTVSVDQKVYDNTEAAVLFGSLIGSRYLALQQIKAPGTELKPGSTIPISRTHGSFDISELFDAVRPIFQTISGSDVNTFVQNLLLIMTGDGRGLGPVLADLNKVISVASNQEPVVNAIADNINAVVSKFQRQSPTIDRMIDQVLDVVDQVYAKYSDLKVLLSRSINGLNWILPVVSKVFGLYYDNFAAGDRFYNQEVPAALVVFLREALAAIPDALRTLNGLFGEKNSAQRWACLAGLPVPTTITMGTQRMESCK